MARTVEELLEDQGIQLCVVATPNDSHFELARACLLAGRDVVVDKPFAPTLGEAEELAGMAAERGRLDHRVPGPEVGWGFWKTVKEIVKSGKLGTVVEYECRYDRFRPEPKANAWRERADQPGAGVLFDLGPHVIDQALVLFGEPRTITASAFCERQTSQVDDSFDKLAWNIPAAGDGAGAHHCVCTGAAFSDSRDEGIVCEVWDGSTGQARLRGENVSRWIGLGRGLGSRTGRVCGAR